MNARSEYSIMPIISLAHTAQNTLFTQRIDFVLLAFSLAKIVQGIEWLTVWDMFSCLPLSDLLNLAWHPYTTLLKAQWNHVSPLAENAISSLTLGYNWSVCDWSGDEEAYGGVLLWSVLSLPRGHQGWASWTNPLLPQLRGHGGAVWGAGVVALREPSLTLLWCLCEAGSA